MEPARNITGALVSGGLTRMYQAHIPVRPTGKALPLVIVLHGGGGSAAGVRAMTGMDAVADQNGFIVAYPNGLQNNWADGRGTTPPDQAGISDVAFLSSLVSALVSNVGVDRARVYATGMSNGGFMAARLGCDASNVFAVVAVVGATMPQNIAGGCKPPRVVPFLLIHGTADTFVPASGGQMTRGDGGLVMSTTDTVAFWRGVNGCSGAPTSNVIDPVNDGTTITLERYTNCAAGAEVAFYRVLNGGHTWPGGASSVPASIVGLTSQDVQASPLIWGFFSRFSR